MGKPPIPTERNTAEMPLEHLLGLRRRCRRTDEPHVLRSSSLLDEVLEDLEAEGEHEHEG